MLGADYTSRLPGKISAQLAGMPPSRCRDPGLDRLKIYHVNAIAGVLADLDPPPQFGPPGPNPLANMDPPGDPIR